MREKVTEVADYKIFCLFIQEGADITNAAEYTDGLLVYPSDGDEAAEPEEGYSSSAVSEEELKYDPSVWQSVIRYVIILIRTNKCLLLNGAK